MEARDFERVYYAQNREDLILEAFFSGKNIGFYVDVGAYHPSHDSVTKRFYDRGWVGINVEPQPDMFALFEKERPKDTNLNLGVSDKAGKLQLRSYKNKGRSTFAQELKDEYEKTSEHDTEDYIDISVKVTTLKQIFTDQNVGELDFLKVDVEGFEFKVLDGNDWDRYRPKVICIEGDHILQDWHKLLQTHDYKKAFFDGLNEYYIDSRRADTGIVRYIDHILIELGGGLYAEDYYRIKSLQELNKKYADSAERYEIHIKGLNAEIKRLQNVVTFGLTRPTRYVKRLLKISQRDKHGKK